MTLIGNVGYLTAMTSLVLGMILMSNPEKAKKGNLILVFGMTIAVVSTILIHANFDGKIPLDKLLLILGIVLIGVLLGGKISWNYKITKMPELIALFNGFGGLAAVFIGFVGLINIEALTNVEYLLLIVSVILGMVTFAGSLVAFFKLSGRITKSFHQNKAFMIFSAAFTVLFSIKLAMSAGETNYLIYLIFLAFFSLLFGLFLANNVGGADMPVLISVLNGLTGVITCVSGVYFQNTIMILLGVFVGFTGLVLTIQMSKAMNRSLSKVFFSSTRKSHTSTSEIAYQNIQEITAATIASELTFTKRVAFIPGFGMATAHAQQSCKKLMSALNENEIEVKFIVHPVAGRMPGHMNVLLAEANIDYKDILNLEEGNEYLKHSDYCFIIGANDVVNTLAEDDAESSIYGMPIIQAYNATRVVVIKRSLGHGYAGIPNPLFDQDHCRMMLTDAQRGLEAILNEYDAH